MTTNLKFLYNDVLVQSSTASVASGTATGYSLNNIVQGSRQTPWKAANADSAHEVIFDIPSTAGFDTFALGGAVKTMGRFDGAHSYLNVGVWWSADSASWTKWTAQSWLAFSNLVGPNSEDWIAYSSTATTSARYWRLQLRSDTSWQPVIPKLFWGVAFDMGRDPYDVRITKKTQQPSQTYTLHDIELAYSGVPYAKVRQLRDDLLPNAQLRPVLLFTTSYHGVLLNKRCMHCRLVGMDSPTRTAAFMDLKLQFAEEI